MKKWIIASLLVSIMGCQQVWAQGEAVAARLAGTVLDPDEAPVPLARIRLTSPEAGLARQVLSSIDGGYAFNALVAGRYELKIEKEGFATYIQSDVVLTVGQSAILNPKLGVGAIHEVIEVTTGALLLNAGNANIGSEVSGKQVVELPLN